MVEAAVVVDRAVLEAATAEASLEGTDTWDPVEPDGVRPTPFHASAIACSSGLLGP